MKRLRLVLLVLAVCIKPTSSFMGSLLGGSITWRLHPQFETNSVIYFNIRTAFDRTDGLDEGTGISLEVYKPAEGPGLNYGDRFGVLKVETTDLGEAGNKVEEYPNKFIILEVDGDVIHGEMEVEFTVPSGALSVTAKLQQLTGQSMVQGTNNVGGLPACNPMGASQTPCTMNFQANVKLSSPPLLSLLTTVVLPPSSAGHTSAIRNQIPNRHSPVTSAPIVQHAAGVTMSGEASDSSFVLHYWDHDGNMLRPYPLGSTETISASPDVVCNRNREAMTSRGCSVNKVSNEEDSVLTGYEGNRLEFVVGEPNPKAAYKNLKFFYTILMTVSDGLNTITSMLNINVCFPEYCADGSETCAGGDAVPSTTPEFVTVSDSNAITREIHDVNMECHYTLPCNHTLYAGHFAASQGLALTERVTRIQPASPVSTVTMHGEAGNGTQAYDEFVRIGTGHQTGVGGLTVQNMSFGRASRNFASFDREDIGLYFSMCFKAKTAGIKCWSTAVCVKVKVVGSPPEFVSPTPPLDLGLPLDIDNPTPVAVCFGSTVRFVIKAADPDATDLVILNTYDNGTQFDGVDLFGDPYNALKVGSFQGDTEEATLGVEYMLSDAQGVSRDPVTRFKSFPKARMICSQVLASTLAHSLLSLSSHSLSHTHGHSPTHTCLQARDSTLAQYLRWGGTRFGDYYSGIKCHEVGFLGPPMFVTDASREGVFSTPFNAIDGSIDERARLLHAFVGIERRVTFVARDPNAEDGVSILFLADPGLPNGAVPGPNECVADASAAAGACDSVRRTLTWTPMPVDVNRTIRTCATPRDNSTLCVPPRSPDERATHSGWYGEEHCVDLLVIAPELSWTGQFLPEPPLAPVPGEPDTKEPWRFAAQKAYVGCTLKILLTAVDSSRGLNASAVVTDSPYQVAIRAAPHPSLAAGASNASDVAVPTGMQLTGTEGREGSLYIEYAVPRGEEGSVHEVCFEAYEVHGAGELSVACMRFAVQRCMYCAQQGETLEVLMREIVGDANWLRLWAANGNDDADPLTPTMTHPDQLTEGSISNPDYPTQGSPFHVGNLYQAQPGDTVVEIASLFHTSVKEILRMNPDVATNGSSVKLLPVSLMRVGVRAG